ncbi:MAG: alginate O-acetyltransferase complex protein AlgI [Myxococcota bacterium]|jgi:alginate O-acetyltransferase complex protein AlgI
MLFQTPEFLVLLSVVLAGLVALRQAKHQHYFVLAASYVFYGWWDVRFLILLLISSMLAYITALGIKGISLCRRELVTLSGILATGTLGFLVFNWPLVQGRVAGRAADSIWLANWTGQRAAVVGTLTLAALLPWLYTRCLKQKPEARRRVFMLASVIGNLAILSFFKYFNFFRDNWIGISDLFGYDAALPALSIALPVGISFYTFQTLSYTLDVYRGDIEPERSLRRLALFVAYFPQLVAGPILRPSHFLPSLQELWVLREANLRSGFHLILVGLFKKVLIADRIAPLSNLIFSHPQGQPSIVIMYGALLFTVQIYCDFSGYTDIARGIGRIMGIEIPLNFDFPYFSRSVTEFWRRWHISLSSWLRDYLYISLGGNRRGPMLTYFNLMATMVLGGLWHGAAWNFVIWGAYQGLLLCLNRLASNWIDGHAALRRRFDTTAMACVTWAITFYFTVLGWIIFRVSDIDDLRSAVGSYIFFDGRFEVSSLGLGNAAPFSTTVVFLLFVVLHTAGYFWRRWPEALDRAPRAAQAAAYVGLGFVFFYLWPSERAPFIYFQF